MSALNFTPWTIKPSTQHIGSVRIFDSRGFTIANCKDVDDFWTEKEKDDEAKRIAMMMASAPDLLAALRSAHHMLTRDYIDDAKMAVIEMCDAAIQKATGAA